MIANTNSMSDNKSSEEKARESFSSILSYYLHNRESLERIPSWVTESSESGSIPIALSPSLMPTSDEQVEAEKQKLKERVSDALPKLSERERQLMTQAVIVARSSGGRTGSSDI
ncbi:hypothetical protein H112_02929 [Trichophyton rubrum D6]|uniref:Uncharacterized protein n=2 Tax=Trichophyton rubrum TaxID=5551 RepID=F2SSU9_TRIRC|nr:uncharacterized protein TERG_05551 [Trichophyton rubrum CBS 118892]EZF24629.1 hypothetical protein H100_02934 [Trichophyton rubrum MR850]EZF43662.1 hypothetical protein H102_02927 [Trichophyton rubrum CBS 100081]EZF54285.1 hypothetical protein H103_02941 [Trichophyton rubrum CBS 288.86]EZF64903.1 hypothetical protein H104_02919 [Trichophyton rubrum CBS 289.86]EZF86196.1 hypothetical protein H110_02941 [Trichophyton rubrum MR1448]EZF97130.1 hypothetical protein H113_02939 [Trichophyton rubr